MPTAHHAPAYSLFADDNLNRLLNSFGLRTKGPMGIVYRSIFLWFLTWVPPALLFWLYSYEPGLEPRENFFRDVAGIGQCFLGYPLFLFAEYHIDSATSTALKTFVTRPVIDKRDKPFFTGVITQLHRYRRMVLLDLLLLALGYLCSYLWIAGELTNGVDTWHANKGPQGTEQLTAAGIWAAVVGVPIYNYWWLRFLGKCSIWSWVLWRLSRLRLHLVPTHPDRTAGLYFISKTQTSFGTVIFAFGVSAIAATVGHKLIIERASPLVFAVWGPLLGYIVLAPTVFTLPLLAFTPQLRAMKRRATEQFNRQLANLSKQFEKEWLDAKLDRAKLVAPEISAMADITAAYSTVQRLRVVPFDFESMSKLLAATVTPFVPLANWLGVVPPQVQDFAAYLKEIVSSLNWGG